MSKKSKSRKTNTRQTSIFSQRVLFIAAALIVVLTAGFLILSANNGAASNGGAATNGGAETAAIERLSPVAYQDTFDSTDAQHLLLDVRTPQEFNSGHIPGAVNIPVEALASRLTEVPQDQPVVVYCRSGNRSATAARILADAGYSSIYDLGGINAWAAQGLPIE